MLSLRRILIVLGWMIPVITTIIVATGIYLETSATPNPDYVKSFSLRLISLITQSMNEYALSPLCFFGAYLLNTEAT